MLVIHRASQKPNTHRNYWIGAWKKPNQRAQSNFLIDRTVRKPKKKRNGTTVLAECMPHKELREHLATTEGQERGTFLIGDGICNVFGIKQLFLTLFGHD